MFQFHVGAITRPMQARNLLSMRFRFNSTLVQLQEQQTAAHRMQKFTFQFHVGAITSDGQNLITELSLSFNSTLVQLQGRYADMVRELRRRFQFHVGAITRLTTVAIFLRWKKVSIPRWCNYKQQITQPERVLKQRFNSTLVQLQVGQTVKKNQRLYVFQFHVGAITRHRAYKSSWRVFVVSIPRWCNYKTGK